MDMGNLGIRVMCSEKGDVYLPYSLEGNWTENEKKFVMDAISPHVPKKVNSLFNNWLFVKSELKCFGVSIFCGKRATWEEIWYCKCGVIELTRKIEEYYR